MYYYSSLSNQNTVAYQSCQTSLLPPRLISLKQNCGANIMIHCCALYWVMQTRISSWDGWTKLQQNRIDNHHTVDQMPSYPYWVKQHFLALVTVKQKYQNQVAIPTAYARIYWDWRFSAKLLLTTTQIQCLSLFRYMVGIWCHLWMIDTHKQCAGFSVRFYSMRLVHEAMYAMVEIGHIRVPSSIDEFSSLLSLHNLSFLMQLNKLIPANKPATATVEANMKRPALTTPTFRSLLDKTKNRRRPCPLLFWYCNKDRVVKYKYILHIFLETSRYFRQSIILFIYIHMTRFQLILYCLNLSTTSE